MFANINIEVKMNIPYHIGFIMDGNGRWAKQRNMPRTYGHKKGVEALEKVLKACGDRGVKIVSVFAFSTENWNRPRLEVKTLFDMISEFGKTKLKEFTENSVKVTFMGDLSVLPEKCRNAIYNMQEKTKNNKNITLNICLNYSGRQEILQAVNSIIADGKQSVNEQEFKQYMQSKDLADPDIIVRSSGEMRISNFMLYEIAYSEFIFTDELWPDFDSRTVDKIIEIYQNRDRRFGAIKED